MGDGFLTGFPKINLNHDERSFVLYARRVQILIAYAFEVKHFEDCSTSIVLQ
jgi:hypothetical protein